MEYSKHALVQMQRRGISRDTVEEVIDKGANAHQRNNREVFFLRNVIVVVEDGSTVVTAVKSRSLKRVRRNAELGRTMHF